VGKAPEKIPEQVLAAYYDTDNDVFLSMASIQTSVRKACASTLIDEQCVNNGLQILAIETYHIFALADLPFHHKDPFDRLILIQSQLEHLKLASADTVFTHYDVNLFWQ
jgi:PIN domain nuclease of toxin-antitoxin system